MGINTFVSLKRHENIIHLDLIARKPDFIHTNNESADQPVYLRSSISAIVICVLERIVAIFSTCKI